MRTFYEHSGETFLPTALCRGPWDDRFQHGGPPSALLLHEMSRVLGSGNGETFTPVRLTAEFLRPVPLQPLVVHVEPPVGGRRVQRVRASLIAKDVVMQAVAVYVLETHDEEFTTLRREDLEVETWPSADSLESFDFPFFVSEIAYHKAVDVRLIDTPWGSTPVRCWARPHVSLIDDTPATPEEAVVTLADAESGIGPPLDPMTSSYLNPDLTVYFGRRPIPGWTGLTIRSSADGAGIGLSESTLRDTEGVFGVSAQSLVLAPRRIETD